MWIALWYDNPLMRGFIVKFLDQSIRMLSMAVLEPLKIPVGECTVLNRLYVANRVSNCCVVLWQSNNIYIPTDDKFIFLYVIDSK